MTDQMARLRQEAEKRYPLDRRQVMFGGEPFPRPEQAAFIDGRTISREQVVEAAKAWLDVEMYIDAVGYLAWEDRHEEERERYLGCARAALEAAGMMIAKE